MRGRKPFFLMALAAIVCWMWAVPAISQEGGEGEGGREGGRPGGEGQEGGGRRRGGGQLSPEERRQRMEEFRKRMSEALRESLGATAEEWKIIEPRIEAVRTAQRKMRGGMGFGGMRMFGRRGPAGRDRGGDRPGGGGVRPRRPGGDTEEEPSEVVKKMQALRDILDKKDAKAAEIKTALAGLREARKKAEQELTKAQAKLREVLTGRQEATLVLMGTLD